MKREMMIVIVPAITASIGLIAVIFFEIYDRREAKRKKEEAERASQS
jgi:Na+/melibiose symporter-like transporter